MEKGGQLFLFIFSKQRTYYHVDCRDKHGEDCVNRGVDEGRVQSDTTIHPNMAYSELGTQRGL